MALRRNLGDGRVEVLKMVSGRFESGDLRLEKLFRNTKLRASLETTDYVSKAFDVGDQASTLNEEGNARHALPLPIGFFVARGSTDDPVGPNLSQTVVVKSNRWD